MWCGVDNSCSLLPARDDVLVYRPNFVTSENSGKVWFGLCEFGRDRTHNMGKDSDAREIRID